MNLPNNKKKEVILMAKTLVYQLYPRSWKYGLKGMTEHLQRIATLDVDYVWLSPIYPSPGCDGGYDVSDYCAIDPRYGTMQDFDRFVETAHNMGIGVLMDLVINHTSIKHKWFGQHPEYYCWSSHDHPGWHNLFDNGPAWRYVEKYDEFYLHLFHSSQADLNWFPDGNLNHDLVQEFRGIVDFWVDGHYVDGFRLDAIQSINKDFTREFLELPDILHGKQAIDVINAIFPAKKHKNPFLMAECLDPTMGDIVDFYTDSMNIDFVVNILLKEEASDLLEFVDSIQYLAENPQYMLELESHDSPRFPSRGIPPEDAIWYMFNSSSKGICLYQGQELGLTNPSKEQLPDQTMLELDVQTAMRYIKGEDLDYLRPMSRANARIPIPLDEYKKQDQDPSSYLNLTKNWIARWRDSI